MLTTKQTEIINSFLYELGIASFHIRTEEDEDGNLLKVSAIWEVPTDELDDFLGATTRKTIKRYRDG